MAPPQKINVTRLDLAPKEDIHRYRKERDPLFRDRIHAIGLVMMEYTIEETAEVMDYCQKAVRWWISLYNQGGFEDISQKKTRTIS